jgi:putative flippase GtrA
MSPPSPSIRLDQQIARYAATGGANTVFGFAVIWSLLLFGVPDIAANLTGYLAGLGLSFWVNRKWTFGQRSPPSRDEILRFSGVFAVAYALNLAVVLMGQRLGYVGAPSVHLAGVVVYAASSFVLSRSLIYKDSSRPVNIGDLKVQLALVASAVVALLIIPGMPITHDVVWQFWIARQLNNGVELYTQINEVNPPLWFWMAMPIEWLGRKAGIDPIALLQSAIILLGLLSSLLANHLLREMSAGARLLLVLNAFALALVTCLGNFAQREQIAMIVALPYVLLIVRRVEGKDESPMLAIGIGLLAASGFALKHYFAVIPFMLEIWLLAVARRKYRPFRPETLAVAAVALCYAAAVFLLARDYLDRQLPMVFAAYDGYSKPWPFMFDDREQLLWLFCLITVMAYGWLRRSNFTPLLVGLIIATSGFLYSYFAQQKGWVYHSMPVTYFLILALLAVATQSMQTKADILRRPLLVLTLLCGYLFPVHFGPYDSRYSRATNEALTGAAPGSTVYLLSTDAQKSWPMVEENNLVWPSRFMSLWMVPAIATGLGDEAKLKKLSDQVRAETVEDLSCNPPTMLLVDRKPINALLQNRDFDILDYFKSYPAAEVFMKDYQLARKTGKFDVYLRRAGTPGRATSRCRKVF